MVCGRSKQRASIHTPLSNAVMLVWDSFRLTWQPCTMYDTLVAHINNHVIVTWQSYDSHMTITWQSHDSHMTVTWQSHDSHMVAHTYDSHSYLFPTCTWERSTSFFLRKTSNSSPSNTLLRWSRRDNPFSSFPCCCDHSPLTLVPTSCKGASSRVLNEPRERRELLHRGTALETFNVSKPTKIWTT